MNNEKLYYKLHVIFILMLLLPCAGILYFGFSYDLFQDNSVKLFGVISLVYIFVAFTILRRFFDSIITISKTIRKKIDKELAAEIIESGHGELQQIVESFNALEKQFRDSSSQLSQKTTEISILKELSDLCYVTLDPGEILHVTLERALMLAKADKGSILLLDKTSTPWSFVVKACIGLDDFIKLEDRIDYETSIAKYATINKNPLVVEDIENERRFGRNNRLHYSTNSFVIMPIKTINDVIGVLTISQKSEDGVFNQPDIEALTPLLSNAAFTYENIRLIKELEFLQNHMNSLKKVFSTLNSSLRNSELLHAILAEVHDVIPYDAAMIMTRDSKHSDHLEIADFISLGTHNLNIGTQITLNGGLVGKTIQQDSTRIIDDLSALPENEVEEELLLANDLKACLLAPLTIRGGVNGVIVFLARDSKVFYESSEITECITNIVSFALEENRLSASVLKRNQELITIKQIGSALASSIFDINQVLKYTMDMIRTLMNVEAGSLSLLKDDELEFAVAFEIDLTKLQQFRLKLGQGIAGAVASRGGPIIANDAPSSSHFYPKLDESTGFKTRSVLCVPMISKGKVIGVIEVLNKQDGDFSSEDQDILQSIAASVSIALENASLYEETAAMAEKERGIRGVFQKFVPKEIIDQIIHGEESGQTMIDEFKNITLLNIDIRGFSELTKEIGPHNSVSLLNNFFSVMGEIVFKHNGIVDKYLGDGFLALFGAPVATAMDAENAVDAALEMQAAITAVNDEYAVKILGHPMSIGISLYTGEVVVGNIGFERKMDYTVIGDPVNNVFRLQEITKDSPDSIVIAESTCHAARVPLKLEELDATVNEMKVYRLLGRK